MRLRLAFEITWKVVPLLVFCFNVSLCSERNTNSKSQAFRSIEKLRILTEFEHQLVKSLDGYVRSARSIIANGDLLSPSQLMYPMVTRENLAFIDQFLYDIKPKVTASSEHVDDHVTNPVFAFQLVYRLTTTWNYHIKNKLQEEIAGGVLGLLNTVTDNFVDPYTDLMGACQAVYRMQYIYQVSASDFASGALPGSTPKTLPSHFDVEDCFILAKEAYLSNDHGMCIAWMEEALRRLNAGYPVRPWQEASRQQILEHFAYCHYLEGDYHKAVSLTKNLIELDPNNDRALKNLVLFDQLANETKVNLKQDPLLESIYPVQFKETSVFALQQRYQKLCRGDVVKPSPSVQKRLHCFYKTDHPLLRLRPVGVEILHESNPRALTFKGVLNDKEINLIKLKAKPLLHNSVVLVNKTDQVADLRVSNTAWLFEKEDRELMNIAKRVEAISGLNIETAEPLQVLNYGMGGLYEPHHDYDYNRPVLQHRVATFLMYLSDVNWGGGTVFTELGIRALPSKGDALFWFNMKRSGEYIANSQHGGCPVFLGEKWIVNKWFSYLGQENNFACGLSPNAPE
ncbi:prolyl 4-hydroxylase subunit alpha-2-like [Glandiceps talaboti]